MKTAEASLPNDHPVKGFGERASAFFRYAPCDGFLFFWPLTAMKTVPRNKSATSWEFQPPQYGIGVPQFLYPVMGAGVSNQTLVFDYTSGRVKTATKRPEIRGNLSTKQVSPFR